VFVLDDPWRIAAVLGGGAIEIGEAWFWWHWTHKRPSAVGVEALVGKTGVVEEDGWVRVNGELWRARGDVQPGDEVVVRGIEGLTLLVDRR
jgi:membrane protein implicated in regulation of membrane protease activity